MVLESARQRHRAMMLWNLINTFLALVALGIAIWGATANVRQYRVAKRQDEDARRQKKEDEEWSLKWSQAAKSLVNIGRRYTTGGKTYGQGFVFDLVFPDPPLRNRIEALLIERGPNGDISMRSLANEQLRLPHVRKTITDVLDEVEKVRRGSPELGRAMGFLE